jgi:hypothetical protein
MKAKYKNIDEIKTLQKSRLYVDALSQGINPLTGEFIEDELLQNERIKGCFEYVADVLNKLIDLGGFSHINHKGKKIGKFILTRDESKRIIYSDEPIGINVIATRINNVIDLDKSDKITGNQLSNILYELGYYLRRMGQEKNISMISRQK